MTVTRHNDLPLLYLLNVPRNLPDSAAAPLVVCMHGRGADMNDLADLAPFLDDGYRFVFPNAPKPFAPYPGMTFGWSWFDGLPPEPRSMVESRTLLLAFLDAVLERYATPRGKLILSGFSQGGVMAIDAGIRTKHEVAGIAVMSGAIYEDDLPPIRPVPVFIAHGSEDEMIPVNIARRARRVFEEHGIEPEYHEFPMGHQVVMEEITLIREFMQRCLL